MSGTNVILRSGAVGTAGTVEQKIRCRSDSAARNRAPDEVSKRSDELGKSWDRYRRVTGKDLDFEALPQKLLASTRAGSPTGSAPASTELQWLEEMLGRPEHQSLARHLAAQKFLPTLRDDGARVERQQKPRVRTKVWFPTSSANVVVFDDHCVVSGNAILGLEGQDRCTLIFLGGLTAKHVFLTPDTSVFCSGPCAVDGLLYAATEDSCLKTFTSLTARLAYGGHGDGWPTVVAGRAEIDVIDDYVEGKGVRAKRPETRASDLVVSRLLDEEGDLDREAVLERFFESTRLLR